MLYNAHSPCLCEMLAQTVIDWLCWGLTTRQPLRVILCRSPEKRRREIEELVEEMKERNRGEIVTGMKVKKQKKYPPPRPPPPPLSTTRIAGLVQL